MAIGFTFSEKMQGPFSLGPTDPQIGQALARKEGSELALPVTIHIGDLARFLDDPDHGGRLTGAVDFTPWGQGLPAEGTFNLFSPSEEPGLKLMIYEVGFQHDNESYYLAGRKRVKQDSGVDLWADTTTLYTCLYRGTDATGEVIGAGVLSLGPSGLIRLVSSMRAVGATPTETAKAVGTFGSFFMGELWDTYASHLFRSSETEAALSQDPPTHRRYHVPRSSDPAELRFTPQPMVRWFGPSELIRTGVRMVLSSLFGAYADKRELQAALATGAGAGDKGLIVKDFAAHDELWIDYVADLGDGFASTYSVARLLADEELTVAEPSRQSEHSTKRGNLLVLGGDQVYPTAKREEYSNRFCGPYQAAFPYCQDETKAPRIFAIPGNHDWYDGLTAFTRLFCQPNRWIGGWRTNQQRSYFAIDLGHDWWLWGIDVQLSSDIDQPQIDFFSRVAMHSMGGAGKKIILCSAEPSWVLRELDGDEAYRNLAYFERKIIHQAGHEMVIGLSGDLHTYARYQEDGGCRQRFISGGGGAYLYPTHDLPKTLSLPINDVTAEDELLAGGNSERGNEPRDESARIEGAENSSAGEVRYSLQENVYPNFSTSRRLAWRALLFPFFNWPLSFFLAGFYLTYSWIVQSMSKMLADGNQLSLLDLMAERSFAVENVKEVVFSFGKYLSHSPPSLLVLLGLAAGLYAFAKAKTWWGKTILAGTHFGAQISLLLGLMWSFASLNRSTLGFDSVDSPLNVILFSCEMFFVGGTLGGITVGLYLFLSNRLASCHTNEVFSCQSIPDYKHCLRLHRDSEGRLTIYSIAIDRVPRWPREWVFQRRQAQEGRSWFEPKGESIARRARLIEPPVVIPKRR